jgi:hypothetical protein
MTGTLLGGAIAAARALCASPAAARRVKTASLAGLLVLGAATSAGAATTPTVTQLLNAANSEYIIDAVPSGMHAFKYLGVPVTYTDVFDGVAASVWVTPQNQLIIAYQGTTGGENILIDPAGAAAQVITDIGIFFADTAAGVRPAAYGDALNFANFVVLLAKSEGYSTSNIFVTGHSLGGIEAAYVAQQTGLGGIGFEPTGLSTAPSSAGTGANFVNIVTDGDPVANFCSDLPGEQPFAPPYVAHGGRAPHYGWIVVVGNAADQAALSQAVAKYGDNPADDVVVVADLAALLLEFHLPGVQAHDLGVTLSPSLALVDGLGNQNGPVFNVANDMIPQLIQQASTAGKLVQP